MTVFLTSDLHAGHANMILYENRPFTDVDHMNAELVKRWNSVVKKLDTVIVLGDFALLPRSAVREIVAKLHGTKWLIMGNHDRGRSVTWWQGVGFARVFEFPIIYKDFYILSHEPVYMNDAMPYVNCHGHIHSKTLSGKNYVNVSVERWDYTPVNFETIKKLVEKEA